MFAALHHIALDVTDFDWYCRFFQEVFEMTVERERGEAPHRQIWFQEGIQLNETADTGVHGNMYSHIGICAEDWDTILQRAISFGCRQYPDKKHWFDMPDGYAIELKKPKSQE